MSKGPPLTLELLELLLEDAEGAGHVETVVGPDGKKLYRLTPEGRAYYEKLVDEEPDSA